MVALAARLLESVRTGSMRCKHPRRTKCLAASRPRPVLEPVTIMVWLAKEWVGRGMDCSCARMRAREDMVMDLKNDLLDDV